MLFALIIAAVFLVTSIVLFFVTGTPRYVAYLERTLPKNTGLTVPEWLAPELRARNRALIVRVCVGVAAGALAGLAVALVVPTTEGFSLDGASFVMSGVVVGVIVSTADWVRRDATRRATVDAPEQRPTGVRLRDYLSTWSLVGVGLVVLIAVVLVAVCLWLPTTGALAAGGEAYYLPRVASFLVLTLVLLGGLAFIALQLRRPQRAVNPEQLAWDDAVASQAIYSITYLGPFIAAIATNSIGQAFTSGMVSGEQSIDERSALLVLAFLPLPIFVAVVVAAVQKPARHYLRTLWPSIPQ